MSNEFGWRDYVQESRQGLRGNIEPVCIGNIIKSASIITKSLVNIDNILYTQNNPIKYLFADIKTHFRDTYISNRFIIFYHDY